MSSPLLEKLNLRLKDPQMEKAYQDYKLERSATFLTFVNFVQITLFIFMIYHEKYIMENREGHLYILIGFLIQAIVLLLLRKKLQKFYELLLVIGALGAHFYQLTQYENLSDTKIIYSQGVSHGFAGFTLLSSFKSGFIMTLATVVSIVSSFFFLRVPETILASLMLSAFLVLNHQQERKAFKLIYVSNQKLKKFEDMVTKDFPINIAITDTNFQNIKFTNDQFKSSFPSFLSQAPQQFLHKFMINKNNLPQIISDSLEDHVLSHYYSTPSKISLKDALKVMQAENQTLEIVDLTAELELHEAIPATSIEDDREVNYYSIKFSQLDWEGNSCVAIIIQDITDKQRADALKLADQNKDKLIATVSHELRTPINGILGLLAMAEDRTKDMLGVKYIKMCTTCSHLLLYLVNSVLDLGNIRTGNIKIEKKNFSLFDALEELKSLYIYQCHDKKILLDITKGEGVPDIIYSDRNRLMEILINMLGNAVKFTQKGHVKLRVEQCFDKLKFTIQDSGVGIEKDKIKHLFKLFGKLDKNSHHGVNNSGAGIGLSLSHELVKLLDAKPIPKNSFMMPTITDSSPNQLKIKENISSPKTKNSVDLGKSVLKSTKSESNQMITMRRISSKITDIQPFIDIQSTVGEGSTFTFYISYTDPDNTTTTNNNIQHQQNQQDDIEIIPRANLEIEIANPQEEERCDLSNPTGEFKIQEFDANFEQNNHEKGEEGGQNGDSITKSHNITIFNDESPSKIPLIGGSECSSPSLKFKTARNFLQPIEQISVSEVEFQPDEYDEQADLEKQFEHKKSFVSPNNSILKNSNNTIIANRKQSVDAATELIVKEQKQQQQSPPSSPKLPKKRPRFESCDEFQNFGLGLGSRCRTSTNLILKPVPEVTVKNILAVDDNSFNLISILHLIKSYGFQSDKANNGQQCVDLVVEKYKQGQKFDLILMDVQMPVMDGVQAAKILNQKIKDGELYDVPIIAVTANYENQFQEQYLKAGMKECLKKPLEKQEFQYVIDKYIKNEK